MIILLSKGITDETVLARLRRDVVLRKWFRPLALGPGSRIRPCLLCKRMSNQPDYTFDKHSFLLWAHMEPIDGCMSVQGLSRIPI